MMAFFVSACSLRAMLAEVGSHMGILGACSKIDVRTGHAQVPCHVLHAELVAAQGRQTA